MFGSSPFAAIPFAGLPGASSTLLQPYTFLFTGRARIRQPIYTKTVNMVFLGKARIARR